MSGRGQIDEIKEKLNIVDVVREYTTNLKKSGRNYFACCPFHNEKTPSFSVNEEIQRYKCFGCGEAGDVINFIEKIEGVDFPRALELAANRVGVQLVKNDSFKDKNYLLKKRIYEVNKLTADFYNQILIEDKSGEPGRLYARKRKFSRGAVRDFLIGYAPDSYENLKNFLTKRGYSERELIDWSLLVEKNGKTYDKFRKRLMFPIFNQVGDVVGFSGRVIEKDDLPKYLNSSETPVYHKSNILYGLYQGKESIRRSRSAIIVEGNIDVPSAHREGITNIVAPMGTALTEQQLELLKRYADKVIFSLDSDLAGEKALIRSFELTEKVGLQSSVIDLGEFKDLDEYLNAEPINAKKAIENATTVIDHAIAVKLKNTDLSNPKDKIRFVEEIVDLLKYVKEEIEQIHYVQKLSGILGVDEKVIWSKVPTDGKKAALSKTSQYPNEFMNNQSNLKSEEEFIAFLIQYPYLNNESINLDVVKDMQLRKIYDLVLRTGSVKMALEKADEYDAELLSDLYTRKLGDFSSEYEIEGYFVKLTKRLDKELISNQIEKLKEQIRIIEAKGEDVSEFIKELSELINKLK